jgi:hypothetical protein
MCTVLRPLEILSYIDSEIVHKACFSGSVQLAVIASCLNRYDISACLTYHCSCAIYHSKQEALEAALLTGRSLSAIAVR